MTKLEKKRKYISLFVNCLKNWDFYTEGNTGMYEHKIRIYTYNRQYCFTKTELQEYIKLIKGCVHE